jgi:protein phosphatase
MTQQPKPVLDGACHVLAYGVTHVGRERKNNEDSFRIAPDAGVYLVCDGMGGHASGEIASQVAADALLRFLSSDRYAADFRWPKEALQHLTDEARALDAGVRLANVQVYASALANPQHKGMGTTVVGMLAGPQRLGLVHVGDSRIYRLRGAQFEQLTDDHSLLNHYLRTRPMTPEQIRSFAGKNVIVRAVGLRDSVDPEVQVCDYLPGDIYLMCSDGLNDMVHDEAIAHAMRALRHDLEAMGNRLIDLALHGGGKDNVTVLLLRVDAGASSAYDTLELDVSDGQIDTSPGFDVDGESWADAETLTEYDATQMRQVRRTIPPGEESD